VKADDVPDVLTHPARVHARAVAAHRARLTSLIVCEKLYAHFNADAARTSDEDIARAERRFSRRFPRQVPR